MRRRVEKRFVFTQLSAVPIFFGALMATGFFVFLPLVRLFEVDLDAPADAKLIVVLVLFGVALLVAVSAAWYAWRRFLVWIGLLSAEEAEGYPYSEPWKR